MAAAEADRGAAVAGVRSLEYLTPHARRAREWTRQRPSGADGAPERLAPTHAGVRRTRVRADRLDAGCQPPPPPQDN